MNLRLAVRLGRRVFAVAAIAVSMMMSVVSPGVASSAPGEADDPQSSRRALVVGIDTYAARGATPRRLRNLTGAVHDAEAVGRVLRDIYGFEVETLLDGAATRARVLGAIGRLVQATSPGDEVVFFFAGHGSTVRNSASVEGRDETLVPADAAQGVPDIRDKELRRLFNTAISRGGRLTILLDSCHSGSAVRGLPGDRERRFVRPMEGDVADGAPPGPPLERAALILAAAGRDEAAYTLNTGEGQPHGLFTHSLLESLGPAASRESAEHVFRRLRGRVWAEGYAQNPVLLGPPARLAAPLFGGRSKSLDGAAATVLAIREDGSVTLAGGWATGLSEGSILRRVDATGGPTSLILRLVDVELTRSRGVPVDETSAGSPAEQHDLFVLEKWSVPARANLRVYMPPNGPSASDLRILAGRLAKLAEELGVRWVADPVADAPSHVVLWRQGTWWLVTLGESGGETRRELGVPPDVASLRRELRKGADLFFQLPVPSELRNQVRLGRGTGHDGIELAGEIAEATYVLVGRSHEGELEFAWVRPEAGVGDRLSPLPPTTRWEALGVGHVAAVETGLALQDLAARLGRIRAWQTLESPGGGGWPYRLALRDSRHTVRRGAVAGAGPGRGSAAGQRLSRGEELGIVLELPEEVQERAVAKRWVYVFFIDSHGESTLIFPVSPPGLRCDLRNPLPPTRWEAPPLLAIGCHPAVLEVGDPVGVDTYFLLATSEPLAHPGVLSFEGVKGPEPRGSPLEQLLRSRGATNRGGPHLVPTDWSIQRITFETVNETISPADRAP